MSFLDTKISDWLPTLIPNPSWFQNAPTGETASPASGRRELISYLKKQKFIALTIPQNHVKKGSKDNIVATREINKAPFSPGREGLGMRGERSNP